MRQHSVFTLSGSRRAAERCRRGAAADRKCLSTICPYRGRDGNPPVVGELRFVNDQAGIGPPSCTASRILSNGTTTGVEIRLEDLQRQIRGRQRARNGDLLALDFFGFHGRVRHHHGAVAIAHARPAGHQGIFVGHIRIRVIGNRAQLVNALTRFVVQGFDIRENVAKGHERRADLLRGKSVEHERVIGVRTMGAHDFEWLLLRHTGANCSVSHGRFSGTIYVKKVIFSVAAMAGLFGSFGEFARFRFVLFHVTFLCGVCFGALVRAAKTGEAAARTRLTRIAVTSERMSLF